MHRRIVAIAMATVLSFSAAASVQAAPFFHHSASDKGSAGKMISFSIRNDSKQELVLKTGDQQVTIEPGKTAAMKLAEGTDVVTVTDTSTKAAGSVVTKVSKQLQGNTLAIS